MPRLAFFTAALAFMLAATSARAGIVQPGDWRDIAAPYDVERIEKLDDARAKGDAEAINRGEAYDHGVKEKLEGKTPVPFAAYQLIGDWKCRTIKVGGPFVGLVAYQWFECRVTGRPDGTLHLEKITGSQRFAGTLYPDGPARMILLGGGYYHYEEPRPYNASDSVRGPSPDNRDKVAVAEMLGPDHARLTFPFPARESTYDIVELRRGN